MEKNLDTTNIKEKYKAKVLETHEKYGVGELYQFGPTIVELYLGTPEVSPIVRIHSGRNWIVLADVSEVKPIQGGGILIDCALQGQKPHCSINIDRAGEIAFLYSPPTQISIGGKTEHIKGQVFTQTTIDIEGSPEGVRVQIKGTVDAAPRLVNSKNQKSPMMFFLIEENPDDANNPVYHEVWAINKPKQELKSLRLTKGKVIEAILFRHTFETELVSGERMTITRHNLVKVIYVEDRGHSAKRQEREQ
jgi:hypothetical protein